MVRAAPAIGPALLAADSERQLKDSGTSRPYSSAAKRRPSATDPDFAAGLIRNCDSVNIAIEGRRMLAVVVFRSQEQMFDA